MLLLCGWGVLQRALLFGEVHRGVLLLVVLDERGHIGFGYIVRLGLWLAVGLVGVHLD